MTPTPDTRPLKSECPAWIGVTVPAALALAFAIGRWTGGPPPASAAVAHAPSPTTRAAKVPCPSASPLAATGAVRAPRAAAAAAPLLGTATAGAGDHDAPPAAPPPPPSASPEVRARVQGEAHAQLERMREHVVSRCWPRGGLAGGRREATVTYDLTFDPGGREIARGMLEDRRAPAGEFGRCLRQLENTSLAVSPPGSFVTLRVPVTYP